MSATTTATRVGNAITITGDDGPNAISVDSNGNFIMYRDTVSAAEARRAKLGRSKVTLASIAGDAPAGKVRMSLRVKKAYRAKVRRLKRLKTTLSIACVDASGTTARHTMPLTLTR